jgi:hypothetical protein
MKPFEHIMRGFSPLVIVEKRNLIDQSKFFFNDYVLTLQSMAVYTELGIHGSETTIKTMGQYSYMILGYIS